MTEPTTGTTTTDVTRYDRFYIGGQWVTADRPDDVIEVVESRNGRLMAHVAAATPADVDRAVTAARNAFSQWSATSIDQRAVYMEALADRIEVRTEELAKLGAREVGTPIHETRFASAVATARYLRRLREWAHEVEWQRDFAAATSYNVPYGVAGIIVPWNNPLLLTAMKAGSAIMAGCPAVVKASELAPLELFVLAEAAHEVGLPAGVLNVISGYGPVAGEALVAHPDVSVISFTGSVASARRVAVIAGSKIKPMTLELGGKSACVVLDDADLPAAIADAFDSAYHHNGQYCLATTRVLVPNELMAEAEELATAIVHDSWPVGDPLEETTKIGPLITASQEHRAQGLIAEGVREGAKLLTGGVGRPAGFDAGFYVRPTVFSEVTNDMRIAKEEIFAPVLGLLPYHGEAEAIAITNDSNYGLGGAVWSKDEDRAHRVSRALETGSIQVNGAPFDVASPSGGFKESGFGRERGRSGIEEFLTWKTVNQRKP